jgi:hypothetical protein
VGNVESVTGSYVTSLKSLFDGKINVEGFSDVSIESIASAMIRGGWPASIGDEESIALRHAVDYGEAVINADISRVDGVDKNPARVRALMRSYARNIRMLEGLIRQNSDNPRSTFSRNLMTAYS